MSPEQVKELQRILGARETGVLDADTLKRIQMLADAPQAPALPFPNSPPMERTPELPELPPAPGAPQLPALDSATVVQPDIENIISPAGHVGPGGSVSGPELAARDAARARARDVGLSAHAGREAMADRQRKILQLLAQEQGMNPGVRLPDELFGGQ